MEETLQQNQMLTTISKKVGKKPNNTKSKFSKLLFAAFTKGNRAPNGRAKGVRYWLLSQYKHLTHHPERPHERKEDSFFESFCNYMESLQSRGKLVLIIMFEVDHNYKTFHIYYIGLVSKLSSISYRCLSNWFSADFKDTG